MKEKFKIGFDIDGVVVDFNTSFLYAARNKFDMLHGVTKDDIVKYNYYECIDISDKQCWDIVEYVLLNPTECKTKPIDGSVEVLTKLSTYMDLLFVTARINKTIETTKKVLHTFLPDVDKDKIKIIHTRGSKKHEVLKKFGINYFVDDRLKTYHILKQNNINPILFTHPWNKTEEELVRVKDWSELYNLISKKRIN